MKNQLEAFVVKRRKILLPVNEVVSYEWINSYWTGANRKIVPSEILIEAHEEKSDGYTLYGTEIPMIFSYPKLMKMTDPDQAICLGVETRQWEISKTSKREDPNFRKEFHYIGKRITDEEVIQWLEQEKNIESMKIVRTWALAYGKELSLYQKYASYVEEQWERNQREKLKRDEMIDIQNPLLEKRNELVKKYQQ